MRKLLVALLVLALAGLAAPGAQAMKGTVTVALSGEPLSMDPHVQSEFIGAMIWPWGYDNLVYAEPGTGRLKPWLAEKFERVSAQAFKFTLRSGVKFNDGTPLTSAAVKYSLGRIFDPQVKSRLIPYFKDIREVEVIDDRTFIIHTKVPMNGLPNLLRRFGHIVNPKTKGMDGTTRISFALGILVLGCSGTDDPGQQGTAGASTTRTAGRRCAGWEHLPISPMPCRCSARRRPGGLPASSLRPTAVWD